MNDYEMNELIPVVSWLTQKYTSNESTSITYDKAKQLMGAVEYCINEFQCAPENNEDKLLMSKTRVGAMTAYNKGYDMVVDKIKKTQKLYNNLIIIFNAYGNDNYKETIINGITGFFKYYDPRFNPQDHILTLDYPTLEGVDGKCGIDAIYSYIIQIYKEQKFLKKLPETYVVDVLKKYCNDYELLYCNICNLVVRKIICSMIIGKNVSDTEFVESDYLKIKNFIETKSVEVLINEFRKLLYLLIKKEYDNEQELLRYLSCDMENFAVELINSATNNSIENVIG